LDDTTAFELAFREGIPMIATVSLSRIGDRYQLVGRITDSEGSGPRAIRIIVAAESLLPERIGDLSQQLRMMAGERKSVALGHPGLPKVTTRSLKALELYAGVIRTSSDGAGGPIEPLEQAVALDSGFAAAYRLLSIRYLQERRFSDARRALASALRYRDRLTPVEQGLLDATTAAMSGWTDTVALRSALDRVLAIDPQNWIALVNRANYESWHQDPRKAEAYAARALALDPSHPGGWLILFWSRLQRGDSVGAAAALDEGTRLAGGTAPYLHEWSIYGWRFGDFSRAEAQLDSLGRIPGIADSAREDYPIIGSSVDFLRGRHHAAEARWARFAARLPPSRGAQILASTLFREAECLALAHIPPSQIQRHLARRSATIDLTNIEVNERESARNYLAGAWAWAGAPEKARELLAIERRPDSLLIPWVLHTRTFIELLILVAEGRDSEVIARGRTLPRSAQLGILALPVALAFDRSGEEDSVLATGTRFFGRRTFIAIASDFGCAEQVLRVRMGEILEARGDTAGARQYYDRYLRTWPHPEPEFREQSAQVRQRLAALGAGTDRPR
jgi:tetratricopeptide (TPR) repeat protein